MRGNRSENQILRIPIAHRIGGMALGTIIRKSRSGTVASPFIEVLMVSVASLYQFGWSIGALKDIVL
jgi:hypothetical protein